MREEGCPPPQFQVSDVRVVCGLPAHPRHALAREHRAIEQAISLGDFERAQKSVLELLAQDPGNMRTIQLFAEMQRALNSAGHVLTLAGTPSREDLAVARKLYLETPKAE